MKPSQWYDKLQTIWQSPRSAWIGLGVVAVCLLLIVLNWALLPNLTRSHQHTTKLSFVLTNDEAEKWRSLIDEFEATHPNIDIDLVNLRDRDAIKPQDPRAFKQQYIDSFKSQEKPPYDLIFMDIIWVPEFAENQWIQALPLSPNDPELKKFLSVDVKGGIYQNKLYRMPVRSDIGWLYYRSDILKKEGLKPPETFEELSDISRKLKAKGLRWGYLWQGGQAETIVAMFVEVLHGYGGFWIKPETSEVGLDQPEAIAAVEFLHDTMFDDNPISPKTLTTFREDETLELFLEGNAVFLRNWSNVLPKANLEESTNSESRNTIRNKIGVKQMVHAGGSSAGCQGGWGLGISKKTQHFSEAWQAVQFFSSAAAQRKLFLAGTDGLPTRRDLFKDPQLVKRYSYYPAFLKLLENPTSVVFRPAIPQYDRATCVLQKYLHTALTQKHSDIKQKMKDAARDTRILLKTMDGIPEQKDCFSK